MILIIGWLIGFVGFPYGGLIHILPVIPVFAILVRIIEGEKAVEIFIPLK